MEPTTKAATSKTNTNKLHTFKTLNTLHVGLASIT